MGVSIMRYRYEKAKMSDDENVQYVLGSICAGLMGSEQKKKKCSIS